MIASLCLCAHTHTPRTRAWPSTARLIWFDGGGGDGGDHWQQASEQCFDWAIQWPLSTHSLIVRWMRLFAWPSFLPQSLTNSVVIGANKRLNGCLIGRHYQLGYMFQVWTTGRRGPSNVPRTHGHGGTRARCAVNGPMDWFVYFQVNGSFAQWTNSSVAATLTDWLAAWRVMDVQSNGVNQAVCTHHHDSFIASTRPDWLVSVQPFHCSTIWTSC